MFPLKELQSGLEQNPNKSTNGLEKVEEVKMNGSIRSRGKGTWELTVDLGRDANGKRRRKFVNVKGTKSKAQQKLRELLSLDDKGSRSTPKR